MTALTVTDLTQSTLEGNGVFDVLMRANSVHLQSEFDKGRIRGPEYATVYLGSLQSVMSTALAFITQRQRIDLEAQLMAQQILLAQVEVLKANAAVALMEAQLANTLVERDILLANQGKITAEVALLSQKTKTEIAQIDPINTLAGSVIGKQSGLYQAQADGFIRDAEQKVAKMLIDTWNVRRTTDEGTVYDETNKLSDAQVGKAVTRMFTGIGLT